VEVLAISSQSPFRVVGENSPIANQGQGWIPLAGIVSILALWKAALGRFGCPDGIQVGWRVSEVQAAFVTSLACHVASHN